MGTQSKPTGLDALAVATLLTSGAVIAWPVLSGGYLTYLDNPAHVAEIYASAFEARNGWSEIAFCGFPITTLHSPLWYGTLSWLVRLGVPVGPMYAFCVWLGLLAPSLALYYVARRSLSQLPALGLAYLLLVQRPAIVGVGSATGGMWTFFLACAALILLIDRLSRSFTTHRDLGVVAALVGLIVLTHLYAVVPLAILAVFHVSVVFGRRSAGYLRRLLGQASAAALGLVAGAAYWVPMVLARDAVTIHPQNLGAFQVAARLFVPTFVFDLVNGVSPAVGPVQAVASLPMVALALVGMAGLFFLARRSDDTPVYGVVMAAVLLTLLLSVAAHSDVTFLGPGSWRMLFFVRVGLALLAIAFAKKITTHGGRKFRPPLAWGALAAVTMVVLGWWFGKPLRAAVPPPHGEEMAEVVALWDWIEKNQTNDWGRVYLQDTLARPRRDVELDQSHVLALTAHRTGVRQVGATYGVAPYRTVEWTPSEFGTLFRREVRDLDDLNGLALRMWTVNATHVVCSVVATQKLLETADGFLLLHRAGRFTVFRASAIESDWASPLGQGGITVTTREFDTGKYRLSVRANRGDGEILVKSSYHPAWRVAGPAGVRIRFEDSGLMRLTDIPAGESEIVLEYRPVRWPAWTSLIGWLGILGQSAATFRRKTRPTDSQP